MRILNRVTAAAALGAALMFAAAGTEAQTQAKFANPDEAAKALLQALKTNDLAGLQTLFGRGAMEKVASGDPVSDRNDRDVIARAMEQSWRWQSAGVGRMELIIGDEQWPFPAPLVKTGTEWQFDAEAGKNEVLARRIGRNELRVILLCRAYADMQRDYASQPRDGKPAGTFAARIRSSPGLHDGLYWPAQLGERPSPLGDLAAEAAAEGYEQNKTSSSPFWGYYFRIVTAQGEAAPGGKRSYVVNGDMRDGFALVAFPAKYGSSGVMTFIVNQDGIVYQKDLGADTLNQAAGLTEYNPDKSWTVVRVP